MKRFLSCLFAVLILSLASCSNQTLKYIGIGPRDSSGRAAGTWKIYDRADHVRASGVYVSGRPHGTWTFWDRTGVKVAVLSFANGTLQGPYTLRHRGSMQGGGGGSLKTTGTFVNDQLSGRRVEYEPMGRLASDAIIERGRIQSISVGTEELVKLGVKSDQALVKTLKQDVVQAATRR